MVHDIKHDTKNQKTEEIRFYNNQFKGQEWIYH